MNPGPDNLGGCLREKTAILEQSPRSNNMAVLKTGRLSLEKRTLNTSEYVVSIRKALCTGTPNSIRDEEGLYEHAGVLVPIIEEAEGLSVLLTKRTDTVEHHKGQISFPGGSVDKEDGSIKETALREAQEEIGLQREDVELLGRLDDTMTVVSNFIIHPFVGLVPYPYNFIINSAEVERIIKVPLSVFNTKHSGSGRNSVEYEGMTYQSQNYVYNGNLIWGATARIMQNFINIICGKMSLLEAKK